MSESDVTYSSKAEQYLNEEQSITTAPLRRSKRLSQKTIYNKGNDDIGCHTLEKKIRKGHSSQVHQEVLEGDVGEAAEQNTSQKLSVYSENILPELETPTISAQFPLNQMDFNTNGNYKRTIIDWPERVILPHLQNVCVPLDLCKKIQLPQTKEKTAKKTSTAKARILKKSSEPDNNAYGKEKEIATDMGCPREMKKAASTEKQFHQRSKTASQHQRSRRNCPFIAKAVHSKAKKKPVLDEWVVENEKQWEQEQIFRAVGAQRCPQWTEEGKWKKTQIIPEPLELLSRARGRPKKLHAGNEKKKYRNTFAYDPTTPMRLMQMATMPSTTIAGQCLNNCMRLPEKAPSPVVDSLLPAVYPPHFIHQIRAGDCVEPLNACLTPDYSQTVNFEMSSTSTPSLPDSLRGVFGTDDIREILNVEKVAYRLSEQHVQFLAMVLNLKLEYLRGLLDKILKLSPSILDKIDATLKVLPYLYENDVSTNIYQSESPTSAVESSPTPIEARYFARQRQTQ